MSEKQLSSMLIPYTFLVITSSSIFQYINREDNSENAWTSTIALPALLLYTLIYTLYTVYTRIYTHVCSVYRIYTRICFVYRIYTHICSYWADLEWDLLFHWSRHPQASCNLRSRRQNTCVACPETIVNLYQTSAAQIKATIHADTEPDSEKWGHEACYAPPTS